MPIDLPKQYDPQAAQEKWYPFWEREGFFNADPDDSKPPHTIMIPLPNVTGALHMGHALNGTVQDLITRWRRMQGYEALWMPGTDHAGIATQSVVERRMLEEEGFEYQGYLDIFDGGPTMTARTDEVASIRDAKCSTVIQTDSANGQRALLAAGRLGGFRSCYGLCEAAEDGVVIDLVAAGLLGVGPGDEVWTVPR